MIDEGRLVRRGAYGFAVSGAVTDPVLLAVAADFDQQVLRGMEALAAAELATRYASGEELLCCTKYDGEGVYLYYEADRQPFAFNAPSGRARVGLPALTRFADLCRAAGLRKCLLRAELILPQPPGSARRPGVAEVIRVSGSGSEEELASLQLVLLDAVMVDGRDLRGQQSEFRNTLDFLRRLAGEDPRQPVYAMEARLLSGAELAGRFEELVAGGAEGVVIRRLNRPELCKVKPMRSVDALVIGYVEDDDDGQPGVSSLLTALTYPPGTGERLIQAFVRVGSGLSDAERVSLLDPLRTRRVPSPLAMTDGSGRPIRFVRPEMVVEVTGEDLVHEERGRRLRSPLLACDGQAYRHVGLAACPRLGFPRLKTLRPDKDWRSGADIGQVGEAKAPEALPPALGAEVLRREVYAKGEMLRKLLVVRRADPELPFPYLVYWTDYSARRAQALKVSVRVAATAERAGALAEAMLAEELSRGFERVA